MSVVFEFVAISKLLCIAGEWLIVTLTLSNFEASYFLLLFIAFDSEQISASYGWLLAV